MNTLTFGLSVALIGMLVVFAGLVILIGCIKLIALASNRKQAARQGETAVAAHNASAPAGEPIAAQGVPADVLAAITAAIAAVWQGETGFVVRRVRRVSNAPVWNRAGREEQTYSRL